MDNEIMPPMVGQVLGPIIAKHYQGRVDKHLYRSQCCNKQMVGGHVTCHLIGRGNRQRLTMNHHLICPKCGHKHIVNHDHTETQELMDQLDNPTGHRVIHHTAELMYAGSGEGILSVFKNVAGAVKSGAAAAAKAAAELAKKGAKAATEAAKKAAKAGAELAKKAAKEGVKQVKKHAPTVINKAKEFAQSEAGQAIIKRGVDLAGEKILAKLAQTKPDLARNTARVLGLAPIPGLGPAEQVEMATQTMNEDLPEAVTLSLSDPTTQETLPEEIAKQEATAENFEEPGNQLGALGSEESKRTTPFNKFIGNPLKSSDPQPKGVSITSEGFTSLPLTFNEMKYAAKTEEKDLDKPEGGESSSQGARRRPGAASGGDEARLQTQMRAQARADSESGNFKSALQNKFKNARNFDEPPEEDFEEGWGANTRVTANGLNKMMRQHWAAHVRTKRAEGAPVSADVAKQYYPIHRKRFIEGFGVRKTRNPNIFVVKIGSPPLKIFGKGDVKNDKSRKTINHWLQYRSEMAKANGHMTNEDLKKYYASWLDKNGYVAAAKAYRARAHH